MTSPDNESLHLLEKQPGYGKITVLVGPDGGGKSFLANQLAKERPGSTIIWGTRPQTWPIPQTDKLKLDRLRGHLEQNSFKYFGLLSLALHRAADKLAKDGNDVIIDSEQTFKWLMWEDINGNLNPALKALTDKKINVFLPDSIRYVVPKAENFEEQAGIIWDRMSHRPKDQLTDMDPKSLEEVTARLHACEHVILALEKLGVTIEEKPPWLS